MEGEFSRALLHYSDRRRVLRSSELQFLNLEANLLMAVETGASESGSAGSMAFWLKYKGSER